MNVFTRGKTLHSQTREVIAHVYRICDDEGTNEQLKLPLKRKLDRTALYTGVSVDSVKRVKREDEKRREECPDKMLSSPGKKRFRPCIEDKIDDFDFGVIRRTIEKFYLELKVVPTTKKLLQKLREDINFPFSRETLRRLLKAKGFYFRKCNNKRKVLMERPNVLHWRYKYLRQMKQYRQEGRNIVYIDETWVDNDLTFKKCWQSNDVFGVISNISSTGEYNLFNFNSIQSVKISLASKNTMRNGQATAHFQQLCILF